MAKLTKKQRALQLLSYLEKGPSEFVHYSDLLRVDKTLSVRGTSAANAEQGLFTPEEADIVARRHYYQWALSWIIGEVKELIPELKEIELQKRFLKGTGDEQNS